MISHVFGVHDDKTLEQFNDVASRAERAALMADGHLGYVMPIGGVAAYRNKVSPIGVGGGHRLRERGYPHRCDSRNSSGRLARPG